MVVENGKFAKDLVVLHMLENRLIWDDLFPETGDYSNLGHIGRLIL